GIFITLGKLIAHAIRKERDACCVKTRHFRIIAFIALIALLRERRGEIAEPSVVEVFPVISFEPLTRDEDIPGFDAVLPEPGGKAPVTGLPLRSPHGLSGRATRSVRTTEVASLSAPRLSNTVLRSAKSLTPRLGSASLAAPTSSVAAFLARFGQLPPAASAIASSGSHMSAARPRYQAASRGVLRTSYRAPGRPR